VAVAKSLLVVMGFTGLFQIVRQTSTAKGEDGTRLRSLIWMSGNMLPISSNTYLHISVLTQITGCCASMAFVISEYIIFSEVGRVYNKSRKTLHKVEAR
jgi:hypothetical protein